MTGLIKFNPIVDWTDQELDTYVNSHSVPTNPLHRKGFPSIGCAPCTRAVLEGEHPRAGRWWWVCSKTRRIVKCGKRRRRWGSTWCSCMGKKGSKRVPRKDVAFRLPSG